MCGIVVSLAVREILGNFRSGKFLVGDLSVGELSICPRGSVRRGNVRSGQCLVGELSCRGPVHRVTIRRGTVYWGSVLGEVSVGKVPSRGNVLEPIYPPHSFYDTLFFYISNFGRAPPLKMLAISGLKVA